MIKIKKYIAATVGLLLTLPTLAFAAFNDVSLTTDTVITIGSQNYTVSSNSATLDTITVNTGTFVVRLRPGSSVRVTSSDKTAMTNDAAGVYIYESTCNSAESSLALSQSSADSVSLVDVTITPSSTACTGSTTTSNSGGNGPVAPSSGTGATSAITPAVVVTPAKVTPAVVVPPVVPATVNANPSKVAMNVSPVFNRLLSVGQAHADVKRLQQLLNSDPDTRIAKSGVGSLGKETSYFGPATKAAIMKFQVKYGIAKKGKAGYGSFGPATRAKFAELFELNMSKPSVTPMVKKSVTKTDIQALLDQVKALQAQLKSAN